MLKPSLWKHPITGGLGGFGLAAILLISVPALVDAVQAQGTGKPDQVIPQATMTAQQRDAVYKPDASWDGKGAGPASQSDLESFHDYSLFWLGSSFASYNLQWAGHIQYDAPADIPNGRPWDAVTLIYGRCTPPDGATQCAAPVTIHIKPICAARPEIVAESVKRGQLETRPSGVQVQYFKDGHAMVWTGNAVVDITVTARPQTTEDAIRALVPIGHSTPPTNPPDFSGCAPVDLERDQILPSAP